MPGIRVQDVVPGHLAAQEVARLQKSGQRRVESACRKVDLAPRRRIARYLRAAVAAERSPHVGSRHEDANRRLALEDGEALFRDADMSREGRAMALAAVAAMTMDHLGERAHGPVTHPTTGA